MKVGMFINYYIPSKGGMETSVINLCKGLVQAGHEPFVFAPKYPNYVDKEKNVYRYESIRFNYGGYFYVIPVPFISNMRNIVKSLNLDIIHSHQPYSLGDEAMKHARSLKIPLVFTYHIKYEDYSHYIPLIPKSIAQSFIRKITTGYSNKSDAVIAPSSAIKKLLLDNGVNARIEIIPSGISISEFAKETGRREELRSKYKIGPDDVVLITACRITEEKNVKFLIKAFNKIRKTCANAKFIIVGDGAVKKDLETMVNNFRLEKDVIFTGLVGKEEIISLYQASDIFVFASLTETQGLVAVEAMSAGIPAVAVKASGIEDMIVSGEDGILTSNDVDEFSSAAAKVINDRDLRKRLSDQARISSKKFTIELWTERIVKLYSSLIKK